MNRNRKCFVALILFALSAFAGGCVSYGAVAAPSENTAVVVEKSFFGDTIYVCQVTATGLTNCRESIAP